MSVSLTRQTSISSTSAVSLSERKQYVGRALSVHGGAGGCGTRISQSKSTFLSEPLYHDTAVINNEKLTMQNLNDRLAAYLHTVRTLEQANRKRELQIREFYEKKTSTVSKDFSGYFSTISELREKIKQRSLENHRIILQTDNAQLAAEDFKMKYETELNMRMMVEADVSRSRALRDSLTLATSDLELQIEQMNEDLVLLKNTYKEQMDELRIQQTGSVDVKVDSAESGDLTKVMQGMREQYEGLVQKNLAELDIWFKSKVDTLQTQISTQTSEVKTFRTQQSDLKKTYQSLDINRLSVLSEVQYLQHNVDEVTSQCSVQLSTLQVTINTLEGELQQLKTAIEQQQVEYNVLLDIKMRLELEIAEYRRLLEGEYEEKKEVVEVKVEELKHTLEKRTRIITEELVDGVVVSRNVDVKLEEVK